MPIYCMVRAGDGDGGKPGHGSPADALAWLGTAQEWAEVLDATRGGARRRHRLEVPYRVLKVIDGDLESARAVRDRFADVRREHFPQLAGWRLPYLFGDDPFDYMDRDHGRWFARPFLDEFLDAEGRPWKGEEAVLLGLKWSKPLTLAMGLGGHLRNRHP